MAQHIFSIEGVRMKVVQVHGVWYASIHAKPEKLCMDLSFEGAIRKALFLAMGNGLISREAHNKWVSKYVKKEKSMTPIDRLQVGTVKIQLSLGEMEGTISATIKSPDQKETIKIINAGTSIGEARIVAITMAQKCGLVSQDDIDQALR